MEYYIKENVNDITYLSELILDIKDVKDLIRADNLRCTSSFVTLFIRTILNKVKDLVLP